MIMFKVYVYDCDLSDTDCYSIIISAIIIHLTVYNYIAQNINNDFVIITYKIEYYCLFLSNECIVVLPFFLFDSVITSYIHMKKI